MFACPLFREFRESDKAAKLKGANFDTIGTLIVIVLKKLRSAHHYVFSLLLFIVYAWIICRISWRIMAEKQCLMDKFLKTKSTDKRTGAT